MICLDTNYLIRGVAKGTEEVHKLVAWIQAGETFPHGKTRGSSCLPLGSSAINMTIHVKHATTWHE